MTAGKIKNTIVTYFIADNSLSLHDSSKFTSPERTNNSSHSHYCN